MVQVTIYRAEKRLRGSGGGIKNLTEHWYFGFLSQKGYTNLKQVIDLEVYTYEKIPHTYTAKKKTR